MSFRMISPRFAKDYLLKRLVAVFFVVLSLPSFAACLHYAVIIDAGSTGSRAHVFEYAQPLPMIPVPVIKDFFDSSTKPGISSYAPSGIGAGASLKPILDASVKALQARGVNPAQVPIAVLGTAGMRLLPAVEQAAIYANIRNYIKTNYTFQVQDQNIRTITGMMEGVYAWLDVNYLQNNFVSSPVTSGIIDMGGASTQIAFATTDTSKPANEILLTINNRRYRVFSQSFLGLGQNQSLATMNTYANAPSCYPTGYIFNSPPETGNFDATLCNPIYNSIITSFNVSGSIIPTAGVHFVAFSGIYFNYSFFNILQTPTQSALEAQINAICYLPWSTLQLNYPSIPTSLLSTYCANGVYFDDLLYNTYQLQGSQLTVTETINGTGIDWTLGALLYQLVT